MKPAAVKSEYFSDSDDEMDTTGDDQMDTNETPPPNIDDDDEVVLEMNVLLAPDLANDIYLLQYPIHQRAVPYPVSAKIKPRHGILHAEYPIRKQIRPRTYTSQTIPVSTHLCLGRIVDGAMHMVPLNNIRQMRPSFDHLNEEDDGTSKPEKKDGDAKKPVTLQRKESERAAVIRERSYAFKKQSEGAEAWINLNVVTKDEQEGPVSSGAAASSFSSHLDRTLCHDTENDIFVPKGSLSSYVQTLNYMGQQEGEEDGDDEGADSVISKKVVSLLNSGSPIPYSIIRQNLPNESDSTLLSALSSCAVLLRGNWCLSSSYLIIDDRLQDLRTLMLLILQEHGQLYREPLLGDTTTLPRNQVHVLLRTLGRKAPTCWVPKISDNPSFLKEYPQVAEQQETEVWQKLRLQFAESLEEYNNNFA